MEECRQGSEPGQHLAGDEVGVGVHIVEHRGVDADRCHGPCVVDEPAGDVRQLGPLEERSARVATLDRPVEVVPVIHHAQCGARFPHDGQLVQWPLELEQTDEMEDPGQHAPITAGPDDQSPPARRAGHLDHVPLLTDPGQPIGTHLGAHDRRLVHRADDDRGPIGGNPDRCGAGEALGGSPQFRLGVAHDRALALTCQAGQGLSVLGEPPGIGGGAVAQPEIVAVLVGGACRIGGACRLGEAGRRAPRAQCGGEGESGCLEHSAATVLVLGSHHCGFSSAESDGETRYVRVRVRISRSSARGIFGWRSDVSRPLVSCSVSVNWV